MLTKPTITTRDFGGTNEIIKTHPAFGAIRIARVSGNSKLFASELVSGSYIKLQILENEEHYQHHTKSYFARNSIIEVEMTHAQFAEAITSLNMGSGVPCTIKRREGKNVEGFIEEDTAKDLIKNDLRKQAKDIVNELKDLHTAIQEMKCTQKDKAALLRKIDHASMQVQSNLPFILTQYDEHIEKSTSDAKIEVESFIVHKLTELGIKTFNETKLLQ